MHRVGIVLRILNVDLFPGEQWTVGCFLAMLGSDPELTPGQPHDHKGQPGHLAVWPVC